MKRIVILSVLLIAGSLTYAAFEIFRSGDASSDMISLTADNFERVVSQPERVIFRDAEGKDVSLSSLRGRVVFINFWATWCLPCRTEIPSINRLSKSFESSRDIVFLMVDVDGDRKKSQRYLKKRKVDLPVYTPQSEIPPVLLNGAIPTTVILNKRGEIAFRIEGAVDYSRPEVKKELDKLVKGGS